MSDKKSVTSPGRRHFFGKAGAGIGVAGIAALGLAGKGAKATEISPDGEKTAGYRETEHVKTFYKLARF